VRFPHLFSPFAIKGVEFRNRIFSTGHDTEMSRNGLPTEALVAYQRARAKGGAGLIIVQVVAVHETARYTSDVLMGTEDDCIPHFQPLFSAIKAEGTRAFVQLFHPGREVLGRPKGVLQAAYAPSWAPSERFRVAPRILTTEEIGEIIAGYGATARRMAEAGAEGVEVVGSHGYLPAQFLSEKLNHRTDQYGGSFENRLRFLREVVAAVRKQAPDLILGTRLSGNEYDVDGLTEEDTIAAYRALKDEFDYFNVIAGTSASAGGATHIAPPMTVKNAYMAPYAHKLKQTLGKPVFVAGRINQPQEAERIVAEGAADMCGMTRAMICDPEMPAKARVGRIDDIRACIACNQACIGHMQIGLAISCIQHPETGRELAYGTLAPAARKRKVMVIGGGPAGMKAAAIAAERGHAVTLYEASKRLGGQAHLAAALPHRAEFGGIVTNLMREIELAGATVKLDTPVDAALIERERPDAVVLATGSIVDLPPFERGEGVQVVTIEDILVHRVKTGAKVVVYDWLADWIGVGIAEKLASEGAHVRLAVNGVCPAISIQNYVRDAAIARLHEAGVEMLPFMRLYGTEGDTVFFVHTAGQTPVELTGVDTLVVVGPNRPRDELAATCRKLGIETHIVGDALSPRTAEEAVFEGLEAAAAL
jgi:2,4-dienoyl-CoA reductase-like NADH-dependent reductase (Old Yellow Enzyme family)